MITTWEAVQGLVFMGALGLLTRGTVSRQRPGTGRPRRSRSPDADNAPSASLPRPRESDEAHETTEA